MRAYLKELDIFDEILETRAGGVVSSHCGPGTLSVLYICHMLHYYKPAVTRIYFVFTEALEENGILTQK